MSDFGRIIIVGEGIGIITGTKMDPSYLVVDLVYPIRVTSTVVYKHHEHVFITDLTTADFKQPWSEFKSIYPEYYI